MMHDMRDWQCLNAGITPGCYNCLRLPSKLFPLAAFDSQEKFFAWLPSTAKKISLLGGFGQPRKYLSLAAYNSQVNFFPWQQHPPI